MNQTQLFDQMPESDLEILKKTMGILNRYFEEKPKCIKPNIQVHSTTRRFLEEVQMEFKNQWIDRKHPVLEEIMREHYVKDLFTMLRQYHKNDLIEIVRQDNQRQTILKFRFV